MSHSAPTEVEEQRPRSSPTPRASGLRVAQGAVVAVIAGALPVAAVARFGFDTDRGLTADVAGVVFFVAIVALLTTPWWPVPSQRGRTRFERIQSTCFLWFGVTYTTHLTWELWWLLLHDRIVASPDAPWAYVWWMYIDGGDGRYATADPTLVTQRSSRWSTASSA